jgi:iron complex transport system ATP-binding protein
MRFEIKNLSYSFGDKKVLRDISFEAADGEFLGLMGPNGSGKTTLLRCMTNYLETPENCILIDGNPLQMLSPTKLARTFAVVPQSSSTDFVFSAYDIVMMGRIPHMASRIAGHRRSDVEIVRSAMERTDTLRFASRPFYALSGGERQRVVIARAIAQQSQGLLLDEPTVYLDINGQFEVMDLIRKLNREEGISVIAVLHDVNLAARYCDRIALLSHGRLEAIGPPKEVLTPETIQSVYGVDVVVRKDPFTDAVYVMPHSTVTVAHRHGTRVHLLCGGGTGGPVMKALLDDGFSVSAGVLNVLDSDYQNAEDLHISTVAEAPFAPIGEGAHAENLRLVEGSSSVIVSSFPVGPGNLKNLDAAKAALGSGRRVFILPPEPGKGIDFVGGKADAAIKELIRSGAIQVDGIEDLLGKLSKGGRG